MACPAWLRLATILTLLGGLAPCLPAQETPEAPPAEEQTTPAPPTPQALTPAEQGAIVEDASANADSRLQAATALIRQGASRESLVVVNAILGRTTDADSGARVLLQAMAREPVVPGELWPPVALLPVSDDATLRALVASAAGSFRTRDAATLLVDWAERDENPQVVLAAKSALTRLSGRTPPDEPGVWDAWLASQGSVDGLGWLRGLIQGLATRSDDLAQRLELAETQLVATNRRLHLALPPEQRSELLASLLKDRLPRLRRLGFDLIDRELASSVQLDDSVGIAAAALIDDPDPNVRRRAAVLVLRLSPENGPEEIAKRLPDETDAGVAEALLRGLARWPRPSLSAEIARWSGEPGAVSDAALAAAWAMQRDGLLTDEADRTTLLEHSRERDVAALGIGALRLLNALGEASDRERIESLLQAPDPAIRRRAAEALASAPESVDAIVNAASNDPALYRLAADALHAHRMTPQGLRQLMDMPAPTPEVGAAAIDQLALAIGPAGVHEAIASVKDPNRRVQALRHALVAPPSPERDACLVELARAQLELGLAPESLTSLDAMTGQTPPPGADDARTAALLALGRIEDATPLNATPEAWLLGLQLCIATDHARAVHDALTTRFAGALTEAQTQRLQALRQQLASATPDAEAAP